MYFSKSTGFFYDESIHKGLMPTDAKKISKEKYKELVSSKAAGKLIQEDDAGNFFAVNPPSPAQQEMLQFVKAELRALRESMLSAVTGIGWEASESGDSSLVQEARNIRNALRDITDDPALNAAQNYEEMRAAGDNAFRRIAAGASEAFSATFKEFK